MSHVVEDAIASQVQEVMTSDVVTVHPGTPYQAIAAQAHDREVNAFPVVDEDGYVLGVVSTADLLATVAVAGETELGHLHAVRHHRELRQARGMTAADLMTSPAVTVGAHTSVQHAAQIMAERHVKRLPVVDPAGRLLGIISRPDVLAVFRCADETIRQSIVRDVIAGSFLIDPATVTVTVTDGVVTLTSPPDLSMVRHAIAQQARHRPGVVAVRERTA